MIKSIHSYQFTRAAAAIFFTGIMVWLLFIYPIAKTTTENYKQLIKIEKEQQPLEENEPEGGAKNNSGKSFNKLFSLEEYLIDNNQRLSLIQNLSKDYTSENWEVTSLFSGEILVPPPNHI